MLLPLFYILCHIQGKPEQQDNLYSERTATCTNCHVPQRLPLDNLFQCIGDTKQLSQEEAELLENSTQQQTTSDLWHNERRTRLTASKFGEICKKIASLNTRNTNITDNFLKSVYNPSRFSTAATSYGNLNEKAAIKLYMKETNSSVHRCGLVVNPAAPFLGASPDGIVCNADACGLIEVKCPYTARDLSICVAVEKIANFHLQLCPLTGNFTLKDTHNYHYQVQGQLLVTGLPFCDFVTLTKQGISINKIFPNKQFMQDMYSKLFQFHYGFGISYLEKQKL